jgi:hypothetical protein
VNTIGNTIKSFLAALTLALAMLALAAPAAGGTGPAYSDAVDRHPVASPTSALDGYPDGRGSAYRSEPARVQAPSTSPRGYDAIEIARTQPRGVTAPDTVASPGFDWGDAGIGASAALAAIFLLGTAAMLANRSRRVVHS